MKRFQLGATSLSVATILALGVTAPMALADDTPTSGGPAAAHVALINPDAKATVHITKYAGGPTGEANDGTPIGGATGRTPLAGVTYKISQVTGVDLTTNAGWEAAQAYYNNGTTPPLSTTVTFTDTTDANGQIDFANLPLGLYWVEELSAPPGTTLAEPFLVTLPMTDPNGPDGIPGNADDNTSWMYDVYVYPKNSVDTIEKQVLDGNQGTANQSAPKVGDNLTYRLTSTISALGDENNDGVIDGSDYGTYVVGDGLSPFVTYQSVTMIIASPGGDVSLDEGTDFTVSGGAVAGEAVVFTFTASGLNKLATAKQQHADARVQTDVVAQVSSLPETGIVPNEAYFIPNQGWADQNPPTPDNPGIPSNEVVSKFGDILIHKTNEVGDVNLAGATFALYVESSSDADTTCTAADITGTPLLTSVATDANGLVEFSGVQLSNWYNDGVTSGAITDPALYHNYCLVETQAPSGYQLLAEPITVTLTQEGVTVALDGQQVEVKNLRTNLWNSLPLTGGAGLMGFAALGMLLVGGGLGFYVVSRRRHAQH